MNLSKLIGNKPQNHVLAILLTVFVVFDIQIPLPIASLIDNILGKIVVIGIALSALLDAPTGPLLVTTYAVLGILGALTALVSSRLSKAEAGQQA